MKTLLALACFVALGVAGSGESAVRANCVYGRVQAFATLRSDPQYLVGTIPSKFTAKRTFFDRRYNCNRQGVMVRRVDTGVYDIRFPEITARTALVSAVSVEAVAASVQALPFGIYRITLRGPLVFNDVLQRRDVPFSIAVF